MRAGESVIEPGTIVRPAEIAALAAVGRTRVAVVRPPRVAVMSTGDEVVEADATPAPHQVRNSNARMLMAQLAIDAGRRSLSRHRERRACGARRA